MTPYIMWAYAAFSLFLFVVIFAVILICQVCSVQLPWMTVADFTTDICRSRLFTSMSITWLLYAFYTLMTEYFIHSESGGYRYIQKSKVPKSIYFLMLSVGWVPHFLLLLQANNPYRSHLISFTITGTGLLVQHGVAATMVYLKLFRLLRAPAESDSGLKETLIFEAILSGALCLAMDAAFLNMMIAKEYIFRFKHSCLAHTREILNHPREEQAANGPNIPSNLEAQHEEAGNDQDVGDRVVMTEQVKMKRQIGIPIVVHVSYAGAMPTHNELGYYFSQKLLAGAVPPRRLVITGLKVITGLGSGPSSTGALSHVHHPDFAAPSASDKDGFSVLTMRPLEGPTWFQRTLQFSLSPGTSVVEVSMLVCGPGRSLRERRELCDMLERERDAMQRRKDDAGFAHVHGRLSNYRMTIHSIDEHLIQLMIERLTSSHLVQALKNCAEQRGQQGASTSLTLDQLQMLFGPTFKALKEKLETSSKSSQARASKEKIELFRGVCILAGVLIEHAEILSCLPEDKLLSVQTEIEKLQNEKYQGGESAHAVQKFVASEVSKLFMQERGSLLEQLQAPAFREWLHENESFISEHGGPLQIGSKWERVHSVLKTDIEFVNSKLASALLNKRHGTFNRKELDSFGVRDLTRNSYLKAGGQIFMPVAGPVVQPCFPLTSVFAFFNATVAADLQADAVEMTAEGIIQQLIWATEFLHRRDDSGDEESSTAALAVEQGPERSSEALVQLQKELPTPPLGAFAGKLCVTVEKIANVSATAGFLDRLDPYVTLTLGSQTKCTSVKENAGGNVIYRETCTFNKSLKLSELRVVVMDKDTMVDDNLGDCTIDLNQVRIDHGFERGNPVPFQFQLMRSGKAAGFVHLHFSTRAHILKAFRAIVWRAVTLTNNSSLICDLVNRRKQSAQAMQGARAISLANESFVRPRGSSFCCLPQVEARSIRSLSVQECRPRALTETRLSTRFVVMQPPDHEAQIAGAKKDAHSARFVPTILWVSCALALLVIFRTFFINIISASHVVDWLVAMAAWLRTSCDRVEMFGNTGMATFQCFTPDKLRILLESEAGAELQKSARDLFELAKGGDVAAATNSLAAVTEIAKQVDFLALQQDLERIKTILVKVQELQDASKEVPPNVPLIKSKADEIDAEAKEVEGSIKRLQQTAELVSKSQKDIAKVVGLSEEVQRRATALQPLVEPVQEIFSCMDGALQGFNWTMVHEMTGEEADSQSDWQRIFLQADEDRNGVVDRAEFARINWESYGTIPFEFAGMDHDASGTVDEQEWRLYKANGAAVSEAHVDADNKQAQSLEELEASQIACRAFLRQHKCEKELREYLPRYRNVRSVLQPLSDHEWLGALQVEPEPDGALSQECELYSRVGCNVPQMQFLLRNSAGDLEKWRQVVDDGHTRLNETLSFVRVNAERLDNFATGTFLWSSIMGNALALVSTVLLTFRLGARFTLALGKLRSGHPQGKLIAQIKHESGISAIQIPKLVGMTLMSFWISYVIAAYFMTGVLCFLFGPWIVEVFLYVGQEAMGFAIETLVVLVISAVILDMVVGKKMLLGGTDEMLHPVLWTWYAVVMLLFNLAKGAALATSRVIMMVVLNCIRFAILDETSFPSGFQGMDPGYSAFVASVYHCNKYRHPILTSLFIRHVTKLKEKMEEETTGSDGSQAADAGVGFSDRRFRSWLAKDHSTPTYLGSCLRSRNSYLSRRPDQGMEIYHSAPDVVYAEADGNLPPWPGIEPTKKPQDEIHPGDVRIHTGRRVVSSLVYTGMSEGEGEGGSVGSDKPNELPPPGLSKTGQAIVTQMTESARVRSLSLDP